MKSLKVAIKDIEKRVDQTAKHREDLKVTGEALAEAAREHAANATHRAQSISDNLGVILPKLQQLLAHSGEGSKH